MTTKDVGNICESGAIAKLIAKGWSVLTPFGDNKRYDIAIESYGFFYRVQVKSGIIRNGCVRFKTCSDTRNKRAHYKEDIDYFAVYVRENSQLYLVPVGDVPITVANLRLERAKNNQEKGIIYAEKYLIS